MPILWNRRWNWLNYYDFSLNNLLKIGFNDISLARRTPPWPDFRLSLVSVEPWPSLHRPVVLDAFLDNSWFEFTYLP
jgi:hypothetical protein